MVFLNTDRRKINTQFSRRIDILPHQIWKYDISQWVIPVEILISPIIFYQGRTSCYLKVTKVKSMQRSGTEAIRTQLQPSKPKRKITITTNSRNTKITYGQPREQLFPKRWPLSNRNRNKIIWTHVRWNVYETLTPKTGNREPQQNYRIGTVSNELLGA